MIPFIPSIAVSFFLLVISINAQFPSDTCPGYVCPQTDSAGHALGFSSGGSGGTPLTCEYDSAASKCVYVDGALVYPPEGFVDECPQTAYDCFSRRDNIVKKSKRRAEARAAQPQTSRPQFMGARGALGKKRAELKMGK